jgi:hypothetical protein
VEHGVRRDRGSASLLLHLSFMKSNIQVEALRGGSEC